MLLWLLGNVAYYIAILEIIEASGGAKVNDERASDSGYLAGFSLYLAALVVFRIFFAVIYILKWKCRYCCSKKYKVNRVNLLDEFK